MAKFQKKRGLQKRKNYNFHKNFNYPQNTWDIQYVIKLNISY